MTTTMKGLLKGLRYISHIFEEEKEPEIQIGNPTDVKHVAHIGWDGPSTDPPSWMKDFQASNQSAPSSSPVHPTRNSEIQWVSEGSRGDKSPATEQPKTSRRRSSTDKNASDSPKKKESSSKTRHSRRNHSKESSEGGSSHRSNRQQQEPGVGTDSPQRDASKKLSRRKKSKESGSGDGSTRSRSKGGDSSGTYKSSFSDPRPDPGQDY